MDSAKQIIRWAIPGWTFSIFFLTFILIRQIGENFWTHPAGFKLSHMFTQFSGFLNPTVGILLGAAGIPIGYIIYQIYFNRTWNITRIFRGHILYIEDRGREVLEGVPLEKIMGYSPGNVPNGMPTGLVITPKYSHWPKSGTIPARFLPTVRVLDMNAFRDPSGNLWNEDSLETAIKDNWSLTLFIWYRFIVHDFEEINRQITYMFDIAHSQGAVVWSLMLAFLSYNLYNSLVNVPQILNPSWEVLARGLFIFIADLVVAIVVYKAIVSTRRTVVSQIIFLMRRVILHKSNLLETSPSAAPPPIRPLPEEQ